MSVYQTNQDELAAKKDSVLVLRKSTDTDRDSSNPSGQHRLTPDEDTKLQKQEPIDMGTIHKATHGNVSSEYQTNKGTYHRRFRAETSTLSQR